MFEKILDNKNPRKQFFQILEEIKNQNKNKIAFYPYNSMNNLDHIDTLLKDTPYTTEKILNVSSINDIGGADGDIAFYCEHIGAKNVTLIDHSLTNYNKLDAARFIKNYTNSQIGISDINLDSTQGWDKIAPVKTTIFLGILYHLQNPFLALSQIAKKSEFLILSTKVFDSVQGEAFSDYPFAYFYLSGECNNDDTNWWCFTDGCLKRMIDRAGWDIIAYKRFGYEKTAEPSSMEKDGRAFAVLVRK